MWDTYATDNTIFYTSEYMKVHIFELRRMKWNHDWSSQLYTQLKQLRNWSLKKKLRPERDSNPWPLRYRCSALPTELSSQLGAGQTYLHYILYTTILYNTYDTATCVTYITNYICSKKKYNKTNNKNKTKKKKTKAESKTKGGMYGKF